MFRENFRAKFGGDQTYDLFKKNVNHFDSGNAGNPNVD